MEWSSNHCVLKVSQQFAATGLGFFNRFQHKTNETDVIDSVIQIYRLVETRSLTCCIKTCYNRQAISMVDE